MSDDADRPPPGPNGIPVSGGGPPAGVPADPYGRADPAQTAPGASVGATSWLVRSPDLAGVRRYVLGTAALAGLDTELAEQFTLAVNEVMINAILHAGGEAMVDVAATKPSDGRDGEITVTVTDTGPGFTGHAPDELPPADQVHGRGLWLVRRMCDDVEIDSSPRGTVVRLRATGSPAPAGPAAAGAENDRR